MLKTLATATLLTAAAIGATPAAAVITTFASFNAVGNGNFIFANNGTNGTNTNYTSNGTGGSLYTTSSATTVRPSLTSPGSIATTFSFLLPQLAPYITNAPATFTFLASVTNSPAIGVAGYDIESGLSGTFSFLSVNSITINNHVFAAHSNLLTGTFSNLGIIGPNNGTSGSANSATTSGATIVYTSDFLSFVPTNDRDLSLSLSAITSSVTAAPTRQVPHPVTMNKGLNFVANYALRSFRATSTGSFSTDPAPLVTAIPEPQVWALLVAGFGLVGVQVRRRRTVVAA